LAISWRRLKNPADFNESRNDDLGCLFNDYADPKAEPTVEDPAVSICVKLMQSMTL
jgi:hypothetical protein